jgi:hypothetical protein
MSQSLFYLTTALHVSDVTTTHLQEHKTTVTTASGNSYTVLSSAAIVEELELNIKILTKVSRTTGRDLNPGYSEYKERVPTAIPQFSTHYFI